MPAVVIPATPPYPTVGAVLQRARVFCNDAGLTLEGNLLSAAQPYTFTYLQDAFDHLQEMLADAGSGTLTNEVFLYGVPPVSVQDPTARLQIGYTGCLVAGAEQLSPALPPDFISPIWVKTRTTGLNGNFELVRPASDGLQSHLQGQSLNEWDWLQDQLTFLGATAAADLQIRYNAFLPALGQTEASLVPVMRCERALGYYTAAEFASARGSELADGLMAKGDQAVGRMTSRIARVKQRRSRRRRPYRFFQGAGNY
jgi:hypothetical protein